MSLRAFLPFLLSSSLLFGCSGHTRLDSSFGEAGQSARGGAAGAGAAGAAGTTPVVPSISGAGGTGGVAGAVLSSGGAGAGGSSAGSGGTAGAGGAMGGSGGSAGSAPEVVSCKVGAPQTPASDSAKFPFPQRRFNASCLYPTTCKDADVELGWQNYKKMFVVDGGDGTLRVQRPEFSNDTVSEGIAYGMLFAVFMNDKETFDKIWAYAKKYLDNQGLMHWKIDAGGGVSGTGSATDSDEDMGFALLMADKQWGGYGEETKNFLGKVAGSDFHADGTIKGGDGYNPVNPSYLAPAFYRAFAAYTGDMRWNKILDKSYEILDGAANDTTGLVPDWTDGRGNDYTYDAARTPYRIALDACWNDEPRAKAYVEKIGNFFAGIGVENIRSGYKLDGTSIGEHHNSTFVGPAGAAGVVAKQVKLVEDSYAFVTKDLSEATENYYNMSWALFTAMLMTGNFSDLSK